jgi:hypothetical protein
MAGALNLADGNRGSALLGPGTLTEIAQVLDDFEQMGVGAVMLEIGYPMLLPDFPDSGAYLAFYEKVASLAAARSMALSVELNPVFPDPRISSLHPDYRGLTTATYATEQRQEAQLVIDDLHPKYLTLLDEPSTFAYNLGLPIARAGAVVAVLNEELDGLRRGTTMIGAGIGTWESPGIEQAIATRTSVDYLSVHLYPTGPDQIATLDRVTEIAAQSSKPLVMDETWLSKSNPSGRPGAGNAVVEQTEKNWSFWEPLDARFMTAVVGYARAHGLALVAPFSTDLFFGYVDWSRSLQASPSSALRTRASDVELSNIELSNIEADRVDAVGTAYEVAIGRS